MTRSYHDHHINKDQRRQTEMQKWLQYGRCDECRAVTGQPCREHRGLSVIINCSPHPGRPLL